MTLTAWPIHTNENLFVDNFACMFDDYSWKSFYRKDTEHLYHAFLLLWGKRRLSSVNQKLCSYFKEEI